MVGRVPETVESPGRGRPGGLSRGQRPRPAPAAGLRVRGQEGWGTVGQKAPGCSAATEAEAEDAHRARVSARPAVSLAASRPAPSDQDGPRLPRAPRPMTPLSLSRCSSRLGAHSGDGFVSPSQRWICSPLYGAFLGSNTCSSRSEFSSWLN